MKTLNLKVASGQGLGGTNLVALKKEELRAIDGGWIWIDRVIPIRKYHNQHWKIEFRQGQ